MGNGDIEGDSNGRTKAEDQNERWWATRVRARVKARVRARDG